MSAQAAIVINDGAGTPVARTFAPRGVETLPNGQRKGSWRENAGEYLGQPTIEQYSRFPTGSAGGDKANIKWVIKVPTLETVGTNDAGVTPPKSIAYLNRVVIDYDISTRATAEERSHLRAFAENLLATALAEDTVENLDPVWA